MKKILIVSICILQFTYSHAQYHLSPMDSTIASFKLSDNDWVISLTIEQGMYIPFFDSLGNVLDEDPQGTYIISQINNRCILRKFEFYYGGDTPSCKLVKLINIVDGNICAYTKDSIQKAEGEWIYANVYKDDSLKVYNTQMNGDHSPFFWICFRTRQSTIIRSFGEVDIFTRSVPIGFFHKNLNLDYNSGTFIYRSFMNVIKLLRNKFKIRILE